jgi:hypothetical protein
MFKNREPGHPKPRVHLALLCSILFSALLVPLTMAAPANAANALGPAYGCSVKVYTPYYHHTDRTGHKWINYRVDATCQGGRYIQVGREHWERDDGRTCVFCDRDDYQGYTQTGWYWFGSYKTTVLNEVRPLAKTDSNCCEEPYQRVRFRVYSNGVTSPWVQWEDSKYYSIPY